MAVTENDRWALAFDVGGSVFNWKDTVKEALEEVCMVAVHPSDWAVFTHYPIDNTTAAFCS